MKNLLLFCLLAMGLLAAKCSAGPDLPASVYGKTWLYAYEEDSADVRTYRPNTFDFPPSRGRTGFMLQKDGTFVQYTIAPADGLEEQPGTWVTKDQHHLQISFKNSGRAPEIIEIISATPEVLKIKRKPQEQP